MCPGSTGRGTSRRMQRSSIFSPSGSLEITTTGQPGAGRWPPSTGCRVEMGDSCEETREKPGDLRQGKRGQPSRVLILYPMLAGGSLKTRIAFYSSFCQCMFASHIKVSIMFSRTSDSLNPTKRTNLQGETPGGQLFLPCTPLRILLKGTQVEREWRRFYKPTGSEARRK